MASKRALMLNQKDMVANALEKIEPGEEIDVFVGNDCFQIQAVEKIPFGFKIAVVDIAAGEKVLKYGEVIGKSSQPIGKGMLVHVHNLEGTRGRGDLHTGLK